MKQLVFYVSTTIDFPDQFDIDAADVIDDLQELRVDTPDSRARITLLLQAVSKLVDPALLANVSQVSEHTGKLLFKIALNDVAAFNNDEGEHPTIATVRSLNLHRRKLLEH